jgi:DinB superfamily
LIQSKFFAHHLTQGRKEGTMTTATATTMNHDKALREQLVALLTKSEAHAEFASAVKDMPADLQGKRPKNAAHSPWELLEHLRIAQWDILEFARNPKHKSPDFPSGYWPKSPEPPDAKAWDKSAAAFRADRKALCDLVTNESTDLFAGISHADGQTILRQALLAADHNAYHIGELVLLRRILGAWD